MSGIKTCSKCGESKTLDCFTRRAGKPYPQCRDCKNAAQNKYNRANAHKKREYDYQRLYGIGVAEYEDLYEKQDGRCAICETEATGVLHIDHNHCTGEVRGLLCNTCNTGLGKLKDSPRLLRAAADYLENRGSYG